MLESVHFENYRGFKSFRMDGLARINLLVGEHNCGKTALLEGLQFYVSGGDPQALADAAYRRGEGRFDEKGFTTELRHCFHGHSTQHPIVVSSAGEVFELSPDQPTAKGPRFFVEGHYVSVNAASKRTIGRFSDPPSTFVSSDAPDSGAIGDIWDEIVEQDAESEVVASMQIVAPELESIRMLSSPKRARSGFVVGLAGRAERIPLGSMGEGIYRMLAIATALTSAKGGYLFVDEIDTSLHYSVMEDFWRMLITQSQSLDVQVFATTHSWDCISGLSRLCDVEPAFVDQVAIHRIIPSRSESIVFPGDSVADLEERVVDPR